ncbi:ficolin-1-B [Musca domestica]|uniref:Angiopoietin-related protein 2 n=1 Tax=Musca domestica TaxID=7370 RepID=A0A1I8N9N4_MUSDO|nr:ficolin-1-B [Musca domestica]
MMQRNFCIYLILLLTKQLAFASDLDEYTEREKNEIELYRQLFLRLNTIIKANIEMKGEILDVKDELKTIDEKLNTTSSTQCCSGVTKYDPFLDEQFQNFGDGWITIQRRLNGIENFDRPWADYKNGFGDSSLEFFIGLEKLYALTLVKPCELLIVLKDFDKNTRYAHYDTFRLGSESENYLLKELGRYSGTAGDSLGYHKGAQFSTLDRDNDAHASLHCAEKFGGGWWYQACHESNLNGHYVKSDHERSFASGIHWKTFRPNWYSLKFSQIMVRPK